MRNGVSEDAARRAVITLLQYAGDDPTREGLLDTPDRVVRSYEEFFAGYAIDPRELLERSFEEHGGYDGMIGLHGIPFASHCEHHMVPIIGKAYVAYLPRERVVGISKLARVVEAYARRLQIQERMTQDVASTIFEALRPRGVGVVIDAQHECMTTRGVGKPGVMMRTATLLGDFRTAPDLRAEFYSWVDRPRGE
jgi:GTP cyclohydrolase I